MTVVDRLADDLVGWMDAAPDGVPRRVLLWLDPDRWFLRLARHVEAALERRGARLLRYDPEAGSGQLALKLDLLRLEEAPTTRTVVYLPGFSPAALEPRPDGGPPGLWGVFEYRYKGCVWGRGKGWRPGEVPKPHNLATWLRAHGVSFADDRTRKELTKGGADSRLARYVERMRDTDPASWPSPLRVSDVLEALVGDPRQRLRALLASPTNAVCRWRDEQLEELLLTRISEEFGLTPPEGGWGPEELADAFAVQLALAEAFEAFEEPEGFPYRARLPETAEQRRRASVFLRDEVLPHKELGPRFLRRMRQLEKDYPLLDWAEGREGQPRGLPLLAADRCKRFLARLEEHAGANWRQAASLLETERSAIEAGAQLPDDEAAKGWAVVSDLAQLLAAVSELEGKVSAAKDAAGMVRLYAAEAWRVDLLHLRICVACAGMHGPEVVRRLADRAYFDHISRTSDRFCGLVEREGSWPPPGIPGTDSIRDALWSKGRARKAVIVTDSLRLDLAHLVEERLNGQVSLVEVVTTVPTNTPFGMAALLPLPSGGLEVSFTGGEASISVGGASGLETREGRKAFLLRTLGGPKGKGIGFVDLTALLKHQPVPDEPVVVVFDNTIDEQGHKGEEQFPLLVEPFAHNLRRAVLLLHEAGIDEVHIVTDHGFLLLPPDLVDDLGRPEVLPTQALHKDARWAALKADAPVTDLFRFPLPLAPDAVTVGFPRGVRTLVKAEGYLHGGISLQECVVPHVVSRVETRAQRLEVEVAVRTDRLSTGVVPVVLTPRAEGQLVRMDVPTVTVRLWVEIATEAGGAGQRVTELLDVPVRADAQELRPPLYLTAGVRLPAGQRLVLRALDRDTGRELGAVFMTLTVEWE